MSYNTFLNVVGFAIWLITIIAWIVVCLEDNAIDFAEKTLFTTPFVLLTYFLIAEGVNFEYFVVALWCVATCSVYYSRIFRLSIKPFTNSQKG